MIQIEPAVIGFLKTNAYLVWNTETMEGFMTDPADEAETLIASAKARGVKVLAILLTHGHFDHTLAAEEMADTLGIPIYAGFHEAEFLAAPELNLSSVYTRFSVSIHPDRLFKDGETFEISGIRITVLETPGHTVGSVCYYLPDAKSLISGDTLFRETYGITCHPTGDQYAVLCSVKRLVASLPEETAVYPGHGAFTTIAHEKVYNPALRELPGEES